MIVKIKESKRMFMKNKNSNSIKGNSNDKKTIIVTKKAYLCDVPIFSVKSVSTDMDNNDFHKYAKKARLLCFNIFSNVSYSYNVKNNK